MPVDEPPNGRPHERDETLMGYGLGVFLLALGLILAFAVRDSISAVDLTTVGYILVLAGVLVIALTAITMGRARRATTVARTTHADGSQTVTEQSSRQDTPPVA
jgi:hypothetical protein